jgi:hypothetical protein
VDHGFEAVEVEDHDSHPTEQAGRGAIF